MKKEIELEDFIIVKTGGLIYIKHKNYQELLSNLIKNDKIIESLTSYNDEIFLWINTTCHLDYEFKPFHYGEDVDGNRSVIRHELTNLNISLDKITFVIQDSFVDHTIDFTLENIQNEKLENILIDIITDQVYSHKFELD